ncbi:dihydrolipoamide acetyltransferase component of pyruvate dehydrogenase complex [Pseudolysinimonas kribbensis]|uniref:Dihydrolipoamide acetyltransferase component of pyruvate dehydrogenase complex n=1 Tax=Pseudolysinimonas kribbensis TaxID=433641 RepID=A0ABQ6K424_9MICO|nr:dihydrolipoamide acetyltransferase component of pyruvate dehydrogenase complex [Pseudolysinimonas kribbensis]
MAQSEFPLPDVGEGLTEAEIVSWKVAPGDQVRVNQVLVEIETAKSLVELPSPFAGTVTELLAEEGATVEVGAPIIRVDSAGGTIELEAPGNEGDTLGVVADTMTTIGGGRVHRPEGTPAADAAPAPTAPEVPGEVGGAVLVGYGTGGHVASRRRKPANGAPAAPDPQRAVPRRPSGPSTVGSVIAKPPIRRLAKDLEVDIATVSGTGLGGEVTRDDVIRHAQQASVFQNLQTPEWPTDREERIPVKGVRKAIASAMVSSAFTAPHVSVFTDVNATRTMELVQRLKKSPQFAGIRISPLLVMAKAVIWACQRNPTVNSTWTDKEIVVHHYVNLGIAAATPRGLIVPNIKDSQSMSLLELAKALEQLTIMAREGGRSPPTWRTAPSPSRTSAPTAWTPARRS